MVHHGSQSDNLAAVWEQHADQLAYWTDRLSVNRRDVWGGYWIQDGETQLTTRPKKDDRGRRSLTIADLARHFRARGPRDVVGLHAISTDNTSRWVAPEVDNHKKCPEKAKRNERTMIELYDRVRGWGCVPLLTTSDGIGGFHLRIIFAEPIPSEDAYRLGVFLTGGLFEAFPKQPGVNPPGTGRGEYGSWLRLPGRHKSRDYYPEVWDGERWLSGEEAVKAILKIRGDDPSLIPWGEVRKVKFKAKASGSSPDNRIRAYIKKLPSLAEGEGRDSQAYIFACFLIRDMAQSDEVALRWLLAWDSMNSPPLGEEVLLKKIENAHAYGGREYGSGNVEDNGTVNHRGGPPAPAGGDGDGDDDPHLTDTGNAIRLVQNYGDKIRYVGTWKRWLLNDGPRWQIDETGGIVRYARVTVAGMIQEGGRQILAIGKAAADDQRERLKEEASDLLSHAYKSESSAKMEAMISLARSDARVAITHRILDGNPWLLNCPNGTVDLRTGKLREHRRADYITKLCPTRFDPQATCPRWERFLLDIFCELTGLITFIQRLCGYALTGDVSEQILAILWGVGSNGKSTFVNLVMETMGRDFAITINPDLILGPVTNQHPTAMADLAGVRLAVTSEGDHGQQLKEATIKRLTGGDPIRARRMREDNWEFDPSHKLFLISNHKPRIKGTDTGTWRRIRLIPFERVFEKAGDTLGVLRGASKAPADKNIADRLRGEKEGILAWMVRGCLDWQRDGLTEPPEVLQATKDFQASEDELTPFLEECCTVGPSFSIRSSRLYEAYKAWTQRSGEEAMSHRRFGEAITERGFGRKVSNGVWIKGVTLIDPGPQGDHWTLQAEG